MQKLQLSIPEPCHENWQQMTPTEQGRFCNACAKEVIDFSTMTDTQVLNYFTSLTHEKVCGRALPEQLDRTLSRPETPKKKLLWYWNYVVMFFMIFTKGNNAHAQTPFKPATELTPVNSTDLRGQMIAIEGKRIINGKVIDIDGNPVSFASIKIKGTRTGVSADANGAYSIAVNSNSILIISGAGYKETEAPVGNLNVISTVMEKATGSFIEGAIVITAGGISYRNMDEYYGPLDKLNRVAVLQVKDEETGKPIPGATLVIQADRSETADTVFADKKGMHKIKGIKDGDDYEIVVSAPGYERNEFTIEEYDFKNRKKNWEVLLKKQKVAISKPLCLKAIPEEAIRIRGEIFINKNNKGALYVVDGTIMPVGADIRPEDVNSYEVLKAPQAMALFGPDGANGAVVITTRKSKTINLDPVSVNGYTYRRVKEACYTNTGSLMGAMVKGVSIRSGNIITDSLKIMATKINGAIKVYPNPAIRGQQFSLALKLKQAGFYQVQIADAMGRIILQKQISANSKEHTERVMADSRWSSGTYYISIISSSGQLISKAGFIVQ